MLQIVNHTPFEPAFSMFTDKNGRELVTVVLKAHLTLPEPGEAVTLHPEPCEVVTQDLHTGEPGQSSLLLANELVPEKTATDIALVGSAHAPADVATTQMTVAMAVGECRAQLLVTGNRTWKEDLSKATDPEPFVTMPITYERAFGGCSAPQEGKPPAYCAENPVGCGFAAKRGDARGAALPNIEHPEHPLTHWQQKPPVAGFGFIDASWQPRMSLVGTYDDAWQQNKAPLLPDDFNPDYFNAAHPDWVQQPFLSGGETVQLDGFHPDGPRNLRLPTVRPQLTFNLGGTGHPREAALWQVVFFPNENRFTMTWGANFAYGKMPSRLRHVDIVDTNHFFRNHQPPAKDRP